jgi:tetratricopeptide (TPR) repeat protein
MADALLAFADQAAPGEPQIARPLFIAHLRLGKKEEAVRVLKSTPLEAQRTLFAERLLHALPDTDLVIDVYKAVLDDPQLDPARRSLLLREAGDYALHKQRFLDALPWFEDAADEAPGDPELVLKATRLMMTFRKLDEALAISRRYVLQAPSLDSIEDAALLRILATLYIAAKRADQGAEVFEMLTERFRDNTGLMEWRVLLLQASGRGEEAYAVAADHYGKRLEEDPLDTNARLALSEVYWNADRPDEAMSLLDDYLAVADASPDARRVRLRLADMLYRAGDPERAFELLRKNLAENPDDAETSNNLGYMYAEKEIHLDQALALVTRATRLRPESAAYLDSLGWVRYKLALRDDDLAKLQDAEEALERAVRLAPTQPVLQDHLGDVLAVGGKWRRAAASWKGALRYAEDAPESLLPNHETVRHKLQAAEEALNAGEQPAGPLRPLRPPPQSAP